MFIVVTVPGSGSGAGVVWSGRDGLFSSARGWAGPRVCATIIFKYYAAWLQLPLLLLFAFARVFVGVA